MYKVVTIIKGQLWEVVNMQNIKEVYSFTAIVLANSFCADLNNK